jgi:hypothetical protein
LKPQLIIQPLLILLIVSASSSLLVNTLPENVSTTTVTERYTTTITTPRTETVDVTVTTHTTKMSTLEIPVTTRRIILVQRTVLVPTEIRTSYIAVQTVFYSTCWRWNMHIHCGRTYELRTIGAAAIIRTYVPAIVQEPLTVTSESTIYRTTTETLETDEFGEVDQNNRGAHHPHHRKRIHLLPHLPGHHHYPGAAGGNQHREPIFKQPHVDPHHHTGSFNTGVSG